jgi:hypothetical protein
MGLAIFSSTFLHEFKSYLNAQKRTNVNQILCYAHRYASILETGDASELAQASPTIRRHGLEALTVLAKYIGCYDIWKVIRLKYMLAWGNASEDNLRYFTNYLYGHGNFDQVMMT